MIGRNDMFKVKVGRRGLTDKLQQRAAIEAVNIP